MNVIAINPELNQNTQLNHKAKWVKYLEKTVALIALGAFTGACYSVATGNLIATVAFSSTVLICTMIFGAVFLIKKYKKSEDKKNIDYFSHLNVPLANEADIQQKVNLPKLPTRIGGLPNVGGTCYIASALQSIRQIPIVHTWLNTVELKQRQRETNESFEKRKEIKGLIKEIIEITDNGENPTDGKMKKLVTLLHDYIVSIAGDKALLCNSGDPLNTLTYLLGSIEISDNYDLLGIIYQVAAGGTTFLDTFCIEEFENSWNGSNQYPFLFSSVENQLNEIKEFKEDELKSYPDDIESKMQIELLENRPPYRPEVIIYSRERKPCKYMPHSILEIPGVSSEEESCKYALVSVICNVGGHMITYLRDHSNDEFPWRKLDDAQPSEKCTKIACLDDIYGIIYTRL